MNRAINDIVGDGEEMAFWLVVGKWHGSTRCEVYGIANTEKEASQMVVEWSEVEPDGDFEVMQKMGQDAIDALFYHCNHLNSVIYRLEKQIDGPIDGAHVDPRYEDEDDE